MTETMKSAQTALNDIAPTLLEDLNDNPPTGAFCLSVMAQTALRAYRLGRRIQGIHFSPLENKGDLINFTATYGTVEGISFNPSAIQNDCVQYFGRKNAGISAALKVNPEYAKLFTNIVEAVKSFARTKGKSYTSCYIDEGRMTFQDIFIFKIKAGVQE